MPYIDGDWSDKDKALVMADEAMTTIVETYTELVNVKNKTPEQIDFLKKFHFGVSHANAIRECYIRPAVPVDIWKIVDADAKEKEEELNRMFPEKQE